MKKLFKSRKALSPVVAAIILIAVTVAVSIAVAAWMGALTFTFMKTEELKIIGLAWGPKVGTNYANATLTLKNSGTSALTITTVKVNDETATLVGGDISLEPGDEPSATVEIAGDFKPGTKYEFAFYTATGNRYPYTSTAP